ncbi:MULTISPECIES: dihydrolipoamide acetyltransferase family protein [unclassified Flavobacterium]|uniref:dihydrolipoamide acetyltransferase family protein n=1 Tax=unclassified Flavobacterium TaxID=196869 RepID=UPI000C17FF39|nr:MULTISPECIES: dihydrolipoamide acetyltransferase family protein [unclassified Flavobacterium]PIF63453.1 2-oxoglutarate dehydrogenase E2 component (dihydrolipoamide succinyltransferase) [Flavobacterium sp. 11]WKL44691.1 dihydrolipoamide acetyltransferase family protein [Flavobacterium sp. ZE23DGlu08]
MARFELKLPKMGESVAEATITNWLKQVGDKIEADEAVLEIATDKVDSEVPSEVSGILVEQLFGKDDLVQVGQTIAIIETDSAAVAETVQEVAAPAEVAIIEKTVEVAKEAVAVPADFSDSEKFLSPLVKNIAKEEGVSVAELASISGTGKEGRVTKNDILDYVKNRTSQPAVSAPVAAVQKPVATPVAQKAAPVSVSGGDEIIEMDRMRKLISGYMVASVQTSAHVQSFIEVDVTNIVKWREKNKVTFEKREGEKLTYTPIFMEAVAKALKDFPGMNISVDGDYIIKKKNINLGMAAALPNGNLIVPVIKNADQLNLVGMAKAVNDLGNRAKMGKLKPDDTQGGTYTVTNVGTFGSVFGTPIINQPQVGILALGAIRKMPAVIETPEGDFIGIRQKMFLSHSYDHRVVDGALGGSFVKRVAEYLEAFDVNRDV